MMFWDSSVTLATVGVVSLIVAQAASFLRETRNRRWDREDRQLNQQIVVDRITANSAINVQAIDTANSHNEKLIRVGLDAATAAEQFRSELRALRLDISQLPCRSGGGGCGKATCSTTLAANSSA